MAKGETYKEFIEKFKPKLTTDDCYTPPSVHEAVKKFVDRKVYPLKGCRVVRPFYPGGDYEHFSYPDGCVVIDNPPFSILAKIVDSYLEHDIKFWLYAPTLTLFSNSNREKVTAVVVNEKVTFENGAKINISFLTNIWPGNPAFVVDPCLCRYLKQVQKKEKPDKKKRSIDYPANVVTASILGKLATHGIGLTCPRNEAVFIRKTDSGKNIYGSGFLMSNRMAAERVAAERVAAERVAAERVAAERIELSERELALVHAMSTP